MVPALMYQYLRWKETRFLALEPGKLEDPLRAFLIPAELDPDHQVAPNFEAISYAWGDASDTDQIDIADGSHLPSPDLQSKELTDAFTTFESSPRGTLLIGRNLAAALRHLRLESKPRLLWADAICINQQDLDERASQVLRMGDIFSQARRVIVWLGPQASNSDLAIGSLNWMGLQCDVSDEESNARLHSVLLEHDHHPSLSNPSVPFPFSAEEWQAIADLLTRSWFQRLWVVQEIILANPDAIVLVGNASMGWSRFMCALTLICINEALPIITIPDNVAFIENARSASKLRQLKGHNGLMSLLMITSQSKCSDNRDRAYSILGLLPETLKGKVIPDYQKSEKSAYQSLMVAYFEGYRRLDFLYFCEMASEPTWVPNLAALRPKTTFGREAWATGQSETPVQILDNDLIVAHGIRCDEIEGMVGSLSPDATNYQLKVEVVGILERSLGPDPALWEPTQLEMVAKTLLVGQSFETTHQPYTPTMEQTVSVLKDWAVSNLSSSVEPPNRIEHQRLMAHIRGLLPHCSVYKTTSNSFVLGRNGYSRGDMIYAVLGLRPLLTVQARTGFKDPSFHVLGPLYHPSFTDGQAVYGALPPGWRLVHTLSCLTAKFQKEDGPLQGHDPRAQEVELPLGWEEDENDDREVFWRYRNGDHVHTTWWDPRLTKEELIKRGIKVEDLILS
ncbi:hypothetical protein NW768_012083 [Fusarium equiseti]|uniref:WW domain-containing protein n=1 Tax=Fusarium equiseti TaxID=61235 RepID=A0ABQ8QVX1_FUSEQ|nr:hypothetical protein NW768_012083 [Fusarium equiseti]